LEETKTMVSIINKQDIINKLEVLKGTVSLIEKDIKEMETLLKQFN
jgi:hypothetical protein